jgi:hypothetical protein
MKISFGKYKGYELDEVVKSDIDYLLWVVHNCGDDKHRGEISSIIESIQPYIDEYNALQSKINEQCKPHLQVVARTLKAVAMKKALHRGQHMSEWMLSVIKSLEEGKLLSGRAIDIIVDLCGKANGRRNSKKYLETVKQIQEAFDIAQSIKLNIINGQY